MECLEKVKSRKDVREVVFYDLEKVRFLMKDATGLDLAYAYEDLAFSEDAVFIIQFHKTDKETLFCWFNSECYETNRLAMMTGLKNSSQLNNMNIHYSGKFELMVEGTDEDSFGIQFLAS